MQRLPFSAIRTLAEFDIDFSNSIFAVSPSGRKLAILGKKKILIIDLYTKGILAEIPIQYRTNTFDFNESESHFFIQEEFGMFYDVFSVEDRFGFVRRELAEEASAFWMFSPRLNIMGFKSFNKKEYELFSIYPKKGLNFFMDYDSHLHVIDEVSGSFIFRHPFQGRIEVVDLKTFASHIVDDSIDARFFALTSDKKALLIYNSFKIHLIDCRKNLILRDFDPGQKMVLFPWVSVRPGCLTIFSYDAENLYQFHQYNPKNNQKMSLFQIPTYNTQLPYSYSRIAKRGFFMEKDGKDNLFLQEIEFGNTCELMSTEQKNRRLLKLHMSLEHRGLEIKQWKPKRSAQSQLLSEDKN